MTNRTRVHWLALLTIAGIAACSGSDPDSLMQGGPAAAGGDADGGTIDATGGGACGDYAPGHYALRRLTNTEYTNTVRDLLYSAQKPGDSLEGTSVGTSGFSNDSSALTISSSLVLQYYEAAESLAAEVLKSKGTAGGAYAKLVTCDTTSPTCGSDTVYRLAKRAFRRPLTAAEQDPATGLMSVFNQPANFDQGLSDVIVSVLINPSFITIPVLNAASTVQDAVFSLDNYQLATRLSYTLWQSMPDDALLGAADAGMLSTSDGIAAQVQRMLAASDRMGSLKNTLRDEYAGLAQLASADFTQQGHTNALRDAMIGETDAFFADLIAKDRSPLRILNTNESFVNQELATYYGVPFPAGTDPASFVPVVTNRIGLGSHASVLTNTAGGDATFTNPIKRGHWILDQLFCSPPAPPPAVPTLPPQTGPDDTIRERLALHISQPSCAGCHKNMDAFGLGAEDYDRFGLLRTDYSPGVPVDATGAFPDGTTWTQSAQMYAGLATQTKALDCVPQQLMSYAFSRPATTIADSCIAHYIGSNKVTPDAKMSDLVLEIVNSKQFLMQTGESQ